MFLKKHQCWVVSPIFCLLSKLRHIGGAEMSEREHGGDSSIPEPLPITPQSWMFMPLNLPRLDLWPRM